MDHSFCPAHHGIYAFGIHEAAECGISYEVSFATYNLMW